MIRHDRVTWRPRRCTLLTVTLFAVLGALKLWSSFSNQTSSTPGSSWAVEERRLGTIYRERHLEKKKTRLREMNAKSVADVPLWSFKYATFLWDWYTPVSCCGVAARRVRDTAPRTGRGYARMWRLLWLLRYCCCYYFCYCCQPPHSSCFGICVGSWITSDQPYLENN